ncbi:sensor histidine kinase [Aureivirga marina]|uniref:hypothetical protein n=1 Tax=Aureivirga marina TaxID=1182451 RepID=UPI0018C9F9A5|nr:hypothetical protein [Aureivirga marina]
MIEIVYVYEKLNQPYHSEKFIIKYLDFYKDKMNSTQIAYIFEMLISNYINIDNSKNVDFILKKSLDYKKNNSVSFAFWKIFHRAFLYYLNKNDYKKAKMCFDVYSSKYKNIKIKNIWLKMESAYLDILAGNADKKTLDMLFSLKKEGFYHKSDKYISIYYHKKKEKEKARKYGILYKENLEIKNKNLPEYLNDLLFLAKVNPENKVNYLKKYLFLKNNSNKTILKEERSYSIEKLEIKSLKEKSSFLFYKQKNLKKEQTWLLFLQLTIVLIFITSFLIYKQKLDNKKLALKIQETNLKREFFNLSLSQHDLVIQEKNKDKLQIASELHDGVLSRFFGLRLLMNYSNVNLNETQDKELKNIIEELYSIEMEARDLSHKLNKNLEESSFNSLILYSLKDIYKTENILLESNVNWTKFNDSQKENLFLFLTKFSNINKATNPNKLSVKIDFTNDNFQLKIHDNGSVFSKRNSKLNRLITEIETKNGEFKISSKMNIGKEIQISLTNFS